MKSVFKLTQAVALVSIASMVAAQDEEYKNFADAIGQYGLTWEAHKIPTEDGFILTTFHITGNVGEDPVPRTESYMPIVFKHGYMCDAVSWFGNPDYQALDPIPVRLFNEGFDVWMASDRGTQYCQEHFNLTVEDEEFWAWSWTEMGKYDDVANVEYIKEVTLKDKVSYVGVSQGTVQMFSALSTVEDRLAKSLYSAALIDPCTIEVSEGDDIYRDGLFHWPEYGIYNLAGPGWDQSVETICANFDQDICDYANSITGGAPSSTQNMIHWAQNVLSDRYQAYIPNEEYLAGKTQSELIPLDSISQVPISIWTGVLDQTCLHSRAITTKDTIGERVTKFVTVPWATHSSWGGRLADPLYYELRDFLINPERSEIDKFAQ